MKRSKDWIDWSSFEPIDDINLDPFKPHMEDDGPFMEQFDEPDLESLEKFFII